MFGFKNRRRARLRARPLDAGKRLLLETGVPYYDLLDPPERIALEGLLQVFLHEKRFEGCGGLEITDEMRVTIAGHACLLILGRQTDFFPLLSSVLLYPDSYTAPVARHGPGGVVTEANEQRIGESWAEGSIVLSWQDIRDDVLAPEDGYSVIVHEFAHQLDDELPEAEGMPVLSDPSMYAQWSRVMKAEYERLCANGAAGREGVIDSYGAESPGEFFAVVSECFFTVPIDLEEEHPDLYAQLASLYRQHPAELLRRAS
ncbi:MAG: M90 family metallopeptidase [Candidatus Binatia bacterium]